MPTSPAQLVNEIALIRVGKGAVVMGYNVDVSRSGIGFVRAIAGLIL